MMIGTLGLDRLLGPGSQQRSSKSMKNGSRFVIHTLLKKCEDREPRE